MPKGARETAGSPPAADRVVIPLKLRPPEARVGVVPRPRLTDALEASRARVVLISGPAGSGKTVLARDWLVPGAEPLGWLSVDALDDDPGRFFAHLAAAFRGMAHEPFRRAAQLLEKTPAASSRDPSAAVLAALSDAPPGSVLALDDVHLLESPRIWTFLGHLVGSGPPGLRIVLLTREDPPLRLGRLRVAGELLEIRERELSFRPDESAALLASMGLEGLSPELGAALLEKTEGWAAGLRMAAAVLQSSDDPAAAAEAFGGTHELLVDYLLEEVLRGCDPGLERFLMETSILPRFTVETCRFVTGDPEAGAHLRAVEEGNLFLASLDPEGRWHRYHHLFAELLAYRLERTAPERVPVLRARAAAWFEERGDVSEALAQAAALPEPDLLARLLDRHGYAMLARSEFASFGRWLRHIPEPEAFGLPMFLAAVGWFRVHVDRRADLDPLFDRLDAALADPPPGYGADALARAALHREAIQAFRLRVQGRADEALAAGESLLARIPDGAHDLRSVAEFHVAAVHLRLGDMAAAAEFLERARVTTLRGGLPYILLASLGHAGSVSAQTEGLFQARSRLREARLLAEERHLDGLPAYGIVLGQLADVHYLADELDEARALLDEALEVSRGERETHIHADVLVRLARVDALEGEVERAAERLAEAGAMAGGQSLQPFGTTVELERARLDALASGHLLPPSRTLASDAAFGGRWTIVREAEAVLRMQHALRADRRDEAGFWAERLERESEPLGRGVALCLARLTRAALAADAAERHRLAADALARAERAGYVRPLLDGGRPVGALLEAAVGWSLPDAVRAFVRRRLLPHLPSGPEADAPDVAERIGLTDREVELLVRLAEGHTNRELAARLFVSENTVKTHLKRIFAKLDVSTRTAAVERARGVGLLEVERG